MNNRGRIFVFGDNVNTDEIIPARYLSSANAAELALYCMEDCRPGFGKRADITGSLFVAGSNFGCGSSREHAPMAIKAAGITCLIAQSFARIFLRNCINIGLPIVELPDTSGFTENDEVEVDFAAGRVLNLSSAQSHEFQPYPDFLEDIVRCGGWLNYVRKKFPL
jgi:3-isopropylmalate/(R)-2-methylmalate dehydratase small subunit